MVEFITTASLVVLYFILGGFLRRWYGGGFKHTWLGNNRGIQTTFMILTYLTIFAPYDLFNTQASTWLLVVAWALTIFVVCWEQFQEWSRAHGMQFDYGTAGKAITADDIARYEKTWGYTYNCWLYPQSEWYGHEFDRQLMRNRYILPQLVLVPVSVWYAVLGGLVDWIYLNCWSFYRHKPEFFTKYQSIHGPTALAEVFCGGLLFSGAYLINYFYPFSSTMITYGEAIYLWISSLF